LAKGLEETIQKDLGVAFFVAGDVSPAPRGKLSEFFPARHGQVLQENQPWGQCRAKQIRWRVHKWNATFSRCRLSSQGRSGASGGKWPLLSLAAGGTISRNL
jgi:hypothetical protein